MFLLACLLFISLVIDTVISSDTKTDRLMLFLQGPNGGDRTAIDVALNSSDRNVRFALHQMGINDPITLRFDAEIVPFGSLLSQIGIGQEATLQWSSTFCVYVKKKWASNSGRILIEFQANATNKEFLSELCQRGLCEPCDFNYIWIAEGKSSRMIEPGYPLLDFVEDHGLLQWEMMPHRKKKTKK